MYTQIMLALHRALLQGELLSMASSVRHSPNNTMATHLYSACNLAKEIDETHRDRPIGDLVKLAEERPVNMTPKSGPREYEQLTVS